jgi:tetratricopeptide (TPR) repeat protein
MNLLITIVALLATKLSTLLSAGRTIIVVMALLPSTQVSVAQTDQAVDLDILFGKLRTAAVGDDITRIEGQIWSIWMQGGNTDENRLLAEATDAMNIGALDVSEKKLNALLEKTRNFSEAWNKRATLYFMMGRYEESLKDISATLDLEPRHFGALSGRGMVFLRMNREAEALAAFKEALSINPQMPGAINAVQLLEKKAPEL